MSSKILGADDPRAVSPLSLRQVGNISLERLRSSPEVEQQFALQIEQIQQQHDQNVRDAHAKGMREGEAAGRNGALAELHPVMERLIHTIDELAQTRALLRQEAESDMVKLSLAIARRVLRRELAVDPEALHGLVLAALEKLQGQDLCRVKVHPSHAAAVRNALQKTDSASAIEVIPDASREIGAVIFETQRGNLDASVDSQLQEIERGLIDCLRKRT